MQNTWMTSQMCELIDAGCNSVICGPSESGYAWHYGAVVLNYFFVLGKFLCELTNYVVMYMYMCKGPPIVLIHFYILFCR